MSLRRPLEDESLVDESLVKKRKALSTVVVVPDDSQSLVVLESHVEAQAPAAQAEEISKEEYQRVKAEILAMKPMKTMTEAAPPKMKPTESSRAREDEARKCSRTLGNFLKSLLEHPKFCGYESVKKDYYAIKVPHQGLLRHQGPYVIPLSVFFKNGQPREVEVLWLEKEQCRCLPRRTLLVL